MLALLFLLQRRVRHIHLRIAEPECIYSPWTGDLKCRNVGGCLLFFLDAVIVSRFPIDVFAFVSISDDRFWCLVRPFGPATRNSQLEAMGWIESWIETQSS